MADDYSNPLAPPGSYNHPKPNLSNEDFRRIVMTPRTDQMGKTPKTPGPAKKQKSNFFKRKKIFTPRPAQRDPDEEKVEEFKVPDIYRDRARERRENLTESRLDVMQGMTPHVGMADVGNHPEEAPKGLDYDFLEKVRAEVFDHEEVEEVSPGAQSIVDSALRVGVPPSALTSPSLVSYYFDLEGDDLPMTLVRSRVESVREESRSNYSEVVINKLLAILGDIREGRREPKSLPVPIPQPAPKPVDVANIFEDCGDYDPLRTSRPLRPKSKSYFEHPLAEELTTPEKRRNPFRESVPVRNQSLDMGNYAECYPGYYEAVDYVGDAETTQKKGKDWKAAMNNEKNKLDGQWKKISNFMGYK